MTWNATRVTALLGAVALTTGLASPALASPGGHGHHGNSQQGNSQHGNSQQSSGQQGSASQGIGIGRFFGLGLTSAQITAVHRALVEARTNMQMSGRSEAIAALLKAGTITESQAQALKGVVGRPGMRALVAAGTITWAQAKALQRAMALAGEPDRTAANLAALNALAAAGTITIDQVAAIMARLAGSGTPSVGTPQAQGAFPGEESQGSGHGHGQGSMHGNSGDHGQGGPGAVGMADDSEDEADD